MPNRDYDALLPRVSAVGDRAARMSALVDLLWNAFESAGVSWIGFYLHEGRDELILGPRRNKPACSPIGMHGACGRSFLSRAALVVRDVAELGANYIACDPRDRSEVVIPLMNDNGECWGVLDADSYDVGAFDQSDVDGLTRMLRAAKLTT